MMEIFNLVSKVGFAVLKQGSPEYEPGMGLSPMKGTG